MTPAEILARTLYAEVGDLPVRAIEALAALVLNRARAAAAPGGPRHWGQGVAGVCRAPFQFPCWNPRHPRHARLAAPDEESASLAVCRRVALRALAGVLHDPTGGATHWHRAEELPGWAIARVPVAEIGGLVFHRAEAAAPPAEPAKPRRVA
jgi:spore germination cell wall hydrolase CwlJ-like protein